MRLLDWEMTMQDRRNTALRLTSDLAPLLADFDASLAKLSSTSRLAATIGWWGEAATALQVAEDRGGSLVLHEYGGRYSSLEKSIKSARNSTRSANFLARAAEGRARGAVTDSDTVLEIHHSALSTILEGQRVGRYRQNAKVKIMDPRTGKVCAEGTPPGEVQAAMDSWGKSYSLANMTGVHPLVRSGLAHLELQEIHPFPDGNGRSGRIIIAGMHAEQGVPELPFALEIERRRDDYLAVVTDSIRDKDPARYLRWHIAMMREAVETTVALDAKFAALTQTMAKAVVCDKIDEDQALAIAKAIVTRPITTTPEIAEHSKTEERQVREGMWRLEQKKLDTKHATLADVSFFVCLDSMKEIALEMYRPEERSQQAKDQKASLSMANTIAAAPVAPAIKLVHPAPVLAAPER